MIFIFGAIMAGITLYLIVDAMIDVTKGRADGGIIIVPMLITTFISLIVCIYGTIFELGG